MGAIAKVAVKVAAGAAAAAVLPAAGTWVGSGVNAFFNDPNSGPGWATGAKSPYAKTSPSLADQLAKGTRTIAQQQAQAEAMIRNARIAPYKP